MSSPHGNDPPIRKLPYELIKNVAWFLAEDTVTRPLSDFALRHPQDSRTVKSIYRDVRHLALSSKAFTPAAQDILFDTIFFGLQTDRNNSVERCEGFMLLRTLVKRPDLISKINRLRLQIISNCQRGHENFTHHPGAPASGDPFWGVVKERVNRFAIPTDSHEMWLNNLRNPECRCHHNAMYGALLALAPAIKELSIHVRTPMPTRQDVLTDQLFPAVPEKYLARMLNFQRLNRLRLCGDTLPRRFLQTALFPALNSLEMLLNLTSSAEPLTSRELLKVETLAINCSRVAIAPADMDTWGSAVVKYLPINRLLVRELVFPDLAAFGVDELGRREFERWREWDVTEKYLDLGRLYTNLPTLLPHIQSLTLPYFVFVNFGEDPNLAGFQDLRKLRLPAPTLRSLRTRKNKTNISLTALLPPRLEHLEITFLRNIPLCTEWIRELLTNRDYFAALSSIKLCGPVPPKPRYDSYSCDPDAVPRDIVLSDEVLKNARDAEVVIEIENGNWAKFREEYTQTRLWSGPKYTCGTLESEVPYYK
ncbi:hypothetical protein K458DRAFT_205894 [Lentithecium fluviatile CBS 122367]|uniref:Uncharacterized protein n=1 Tax=Lentithecium fluviatile CBS 122367 TaxID=1168545 RepID=A0A6G1ICS2_9PLEO|nr:hypothetical protein K458DRAFT_205894 [Lentithecium fluviatile CBS 122367]